MDIIKSKDNAHIKEVKKLKEKKYRVQEGKFLIEGFRFVREALYSNFKISSIFLSSDFADKWEKLLLKENFECDFPVYFMEKGVFKAMVNTENPQGIAAVVENRELKAPNKEGFYILADKIQDPGNMGTIIRSAHASGALGVIITKGTVDIYNEKTLRSTMGSIFHVPVIYDEDLKKVELLRKSGFKLIGSSLDTDINFYSANLKGKVIIAVGNEGNGLSKTIQDISDIKVKIPMPGGAESLNVSAAASIMMFEAVRQNAI
ncbi:TrmH family RNA methyltransferase [Clostridium coskatii]|uniref:TrmH family tRNA/rRNA methyltransferase n=1 Tax=Clostridium coskatii TaxID=1705578 RepID=A0A162JAC9_9CLOT|nr:RNA methyltransferase [Clostridium coskatii]OAA92545.1 putative TrmH family tRNA/rRNA methyltransferase [Clostridium coskatii]OBR91474.1 putative TrmH family tRNA/rRNA methyltransferase [Clostridium coskatii]